MNIEEYFKSKADMYLFIIEFTDGKTRNSLLGITDDLYENYEKASIWYHAILAELESAERNRCELQFAKGILFGIFDNITDGLK